MAQFDLETVAGRIREAHGDDRASRFIDFCRGRNDCRVNGLPLTYSGNIVTLVEAFEEHLARQPAPTGGQGANGSSAG